MAKRTTFEWKTTSLIDAISHLGEDVRDAITDVVAETTNVAFQAARDASPIGDTDKLIDGWRLTFEEGGLVGVITNATPYVNIAEEGGWPGARWRTGKDYAPGPRTAKAPGGEPMMFNNVSLQAPRGMMRVTFEAMRDQFGFDLEERIEQKWAKHG